MPKRIDYDRVAYDGGWFHFNLGETDFDFSYHAELATADPVVPRQPAGGSGFPSGFTNANKTTLRNILLKLAEQVAVEKLTPASGVAPAVTRQGRTFVEG